MLVLRADSMKAKEFTLEGSCEWSRLDSIHLQMNVEMCATMKASVCYRIAKLGERYETCCSICKFEDRKKHEH